MPLRLEIGPRDVAAGQAVLVRRVDRAKEAVPLDAPGRRAAGRAWRPTRPTLLQRALDFRDASTPTMSTR